MLEKMQKLSPFRILIPLLWYLLSEELMLEKMQKLSSFRILIPLLWYLHSNNLC